MEVNGELHAPAALPQEKQPQVPIVHKAGWAPESVSTPGIEPRLLGRPAYRWAIRAYLTTLSSDADCIAPKDGVTDYRVWKEAIVAYFEVLLQNLHGGTEEYNENP
jgi:hypothetical protein